ncbi:MAG: purine-nucleoside phosphorylase [Chitinophagales bacterium]|jgi:purine-nucleoside phosphorylase|nr:purine-nucleoside phosphorylase [Chitinophagales bacterium]
MENILQKIDTTAQFLQKSTYGFQPQIGIILGTGLGELANHIAVEYVLPYNEIPNFPVSTVEGHKGRLIFGELGGKKVVAMQGRFHFYEGYTMQQVTFPVRVMKALGTKALVVSNAAGSTNEHIYKGMLMFITDHLNMQLSNPLIGRHYEEWGERFPDMSHPYDSELLELACNIADIHGFPYAKGVYASMTGPNLETKAEYTYLHRIGADAVGMSTVPEVLVAVQSGIRVFAVSAITDEGYPADRVKRVSLEDVLDIAKKTEPNLTILVKELIEAVNL